MGKLFWFKSYLPSLPHEFKQVTWPLCLIFLTCKLRLSDPTTDCQILITPVLVT